MRELRLFRLAHKETVMRGRAIIPLAVGLGVGVVALKVIVNVLQKAKAAPTASVSVVYAASNIEPTLEIQDSMVEIRQVPKEAAPETGFRDKAEVVGRVSSWPIPKGCPIGIMQLAPKGTPPGMAVRITNGFRAVAVKIDESAGVAGWLKTGSRVDVVALMDRVERGANEAISKVILQNVEVLAVGQGIGKASDAAAELARSVTLLVSPADVPKLHLAETRGKLRLAMRNQRDGGTDKGNSTSDKELLSLGKDTDSSANKGGFSLLGAFFRGQAKVDPEQTDKEIKRAAVTPPVVVEAVAPAPVVAPPWTVEVYRGEQDVEAVQFDHNDGDWQRLDNGDGRSKAKRTAPSKKKASPSLLPGKQSSTANDENEIELSKPQAKGPVPGGPARIQ
jgi:pilus assembly protein CpaB